MFAVVSAEPGLVGRKAAGPDTAPLFYCNFNSSMGLVPQDKRTPHKADRMVP